MSASPDFTGWTLLSQGAEARIWRKENVICKERFPKKYRHPDLDKLLTKRRGRGEARLLQKCKVHNIPVPNVHSGNDNDNCIYMDYIDGISVRQHIPKISKEQQDRVAKEIGELVAMLHNAGICHGDLTTSNMMIQNNTIHLIDFGLAKSNTASEERAVDLYVLERALNSTHPELPNNFMERVCEAYQAKCHRPAKKNQQEVLRRLEQVRQRGRKRECFG